MLPCCTQIKLYVNVVMILLHNTDDVEAAATAFIDFSLLREKEREVRDMYYY